MQKSLTLVLAVVTASFNLRGQGTVGFGTVGSGPNGSVNAPATNSLTGMRLTGTSYQAQLFYDDPRTDADDTSLTPVAGIATFNTGATESARGYITGSTGGGTRTLGGVPGGAAVRVQIRAWQTSLGADYATAYQNWLVSDGTLVLGNTPIFVVTTGNPPFVAPSVLTGANPGWFLFPAMPPASNVVEFANFAEELNSPVTNAMTGRPVKGPEFVAQLYVGPAGTAEDELLSAGPPAPFLQGELGYFSGGLRTNPFVRVNAAIGAFQVRVWDSTAFASYDEAVMIGIEGDTNAVVGKSAVFENAATSSDPPAVLTNLQSFAVARVPPMVRLQIARSQFNARVSWSTNANGFVLESSVPKNSSWMTVTNRPTVVGKTYVLSVPLDLERRFFRLRSVD